MAEKFYLTTSIIYTNAAPHLGFAYELLLSDIVARYRRQKGDTVRFLTGTDEHGSKIARTAKEKGVSEQAFVDENAAKVASLAKALGVSNDDFIRTSDKERHWSGAAKLWQAIEKSGDLYKKKYSGFYCAGDEAFHPENFLVNGECPNYPGRKLELVEEENYFFKLSKYAPQLKGLLEKKELEIIPASRTAEMLSLLEEGLDDVSFSRPTSSVSWGIPVPGDAAHTMYVWCDALSNYITALGYGTGDEADFNKFWPADMHMIGKDILRFHSLIWPAMLLSAGLKLPKRIFVHGFITVEGKKMGKSLGNVVDPMVLIEKYGVEAFRYYFAREISSFEDGDYSEARFIETYNANLANGIGNLTSRIMKMAENYGITYTVTGEEWLLKNSYAGKYLENFEVSKAAGEIFERVKALDVFIQTNEPFKKIKTDPQGAKKDVSYLLYELALVAAELKPFLPDTAEKILSIVTSGKMPEKPLFPRIEA